MVKLEKEYWRKLKKEYEGSGLSQSDLWSQQGIPVAQFKYRWRREIESNSKKERIESRRLMAVAEFEAVFIAGTESLAGTETKSGIMYIQ
jgi:hypothetical protein